MTTNELISLLILTNASLSFAVTFAWLHYDEQRPPETVWLAVLTCLSVLSIGRSFWLLPESADLFYLQASCAGGALFGLWFAWVLRTLGDLAEEKLC